MIKETNKRVKELMKELGLNTNDEMLFINLCIFYTKARQDQSKSSLESLKGLNEKVF